MAGVHIQNLSQAALEEFSERGARSVARKTLVDERCGARLFRLRYYVVEPGGQTPFDIHPYEHVIIVTRGAGSLLTLSGGAPQLKKIAVGDVVYVGSKDPHQFVNPNPEPLEFYCFSTATHLYGEGEKSDAQGPVD